ncbi:MAG TPA: biotin/lipoyl-binding protein, partial [Allosphingosinicella sp.]
MAELALVARSDQPQARQEVPPAEAPAGAAEVSAQPPRGRKKRIVGGAGALLLLAGAGLGYQYNAVWAHRETTDNAYVRADITPVAAKVEGYVARLAVGDNQAVEAGDVLMVIEPADYEARVAKAEAELASARANLVTLAAARRSASAQVGAQGGAIGEASARVAAARAAAGRAAADEVRFAELAAKGWATRARLD